MPVFGVGNVYRFWAPKGGPPQYFEFSLAGTSTIVLYSFESLIANSVLVCMTLMRFVQLKKVFGWAQNRTSKEAPDSTC